MGMVVGRVVVVVVGRVVGRVVDGGASGWGASGSWQDSLQKRVSTVSVLVFGRGTRSRCHS